VLELNSYHAIAASVAAGNAVGVMPKSVFDLLRRPSGSTTYTLSSVDTLLVRRQGDPSPALRAFAEILCARAPAR
jgi:DNA-binding transcriptional LysR family regulator